MLKYPRFKSSGCNLSVTKTQFRLENISKAPRYNIPKLRIIKFSTLNV